MNRRVAVIDVGSGTIKLLVAEGPEVSCVHEGIEEVRTLEKEGLLLEKHFSTIFAAVKALLHRAESYTPDAISIVGTSALREAENRKVFEEAFLSAVGREIVILNEREEAQAIAEGVLTDSVLWGLGKAMVFDLGGGSLEAIELDGQKVLSAKSFPYGAIRVSKRVHANIEGPFDLKAMDILETILEPIVLAEREVVFLSGTIGILKRWFQSRGHVFAENRLTLSDLDFALKTIAPLDLEARYALPEIPANRADVFPTALAILKTLLKLSKQDFAYTSFRNLKYGIASRLLN